jgi:quinol monooxygenase YgiN
VICVIVVIGTFDVAPADRAEFVAQRADQVAVSLNEDGCLDYALSLDAFDPGRVRLIERWTSQDALTAHIDAVRRRGGPPATIEMLSRTVTVIEGDVRSGD